MFAFANVTGRYKRCNSIGILCEDGTPVISLKSNFCAKNTPFYKLVMKRDRLHVTRDGHGSVQSLAVDVDDCAKLLKQTL
jgi:arylamine N-acetyltransferase